MGQYYKPTLIHPTNPEDIRYVYTHSFGEGLKLMEHSYVGTDTTNAILSMIWHNPQRVAWIGDYSDSPYEDAYSLKVPQDYFTKVSNIVWNDEEDKFLIHPLIANPLTTRMKRRFLVNHSRKTYIHLGEYMVVCSTKQKWYDRSGKAHTYTECIHPLPLLTACGNDRGGGDFHEGCTGYDLVGTWAFDLIEYTDKQPSADFTKFSPVFAE